MFRVYLKDQMSLKSRDPIPLYYEALYGIWTLSPLRVNFVLEVGFRDLSRFRVQG